MSVKAKRFVIWHPTYGVFLGDEHWSKINHGGKSDAPTFPEGTDIVQQVGQFAGVKEVRLMEVYNTTDNRATREQIVDMGVDGWDPTLQVGSKFKPFQQYKG